jgi:hypothetical protein
MLACWFWNILGGLKERKCQMSVAILPQEHMDEIQEPAKEIYDPGGNFKLMIWTWRRI